MKLIKVICIIGQLLFLAFFNGYVLHYKHHNPQTGLNVLFWGWIFLALACIVFPVSTFFPSLKIKRDVLFYVIFSLFVIMSLNFFLFDHFNILVEYNRWLSKGMPNKPSWF